MDASLIWIWMTIGSIIITLISISVTLLSITKTLSLQNKYNFKQIEINEANTKIARILDERISKLEKEK